MSITSQEATAALDAIHEAEESVLQHRACHYAAPYLILWGCIWAVGNAAGQFWPMQAGTVWLIANGLGTAATVWLAVRTWKLEGALARSRAEGKAMGRRFAMLGVTLIAYFVAMFLVLAPLTGRETGAFITLSWTLIYMAAGAWVGRPLFMTGLVGTVGVVASHLFAGEYYSLALAVVGGGTLITGGLWMRKR
jgi:hypothetical protein